MSEIVEEKRKNPVNGGRYAAAPLLVSLLYGLTSLVFAGLTANKVLMHKDLPAIEALGLMTGLGGLLYVLYMYLVLLKGMKAIYNALYSECLEKAEVIENLKDRFFRMTVALGEDAVLAREKAQKLEADSLKMSETLSEISEDYSKQNIEIENTTVAIVQLAQKLGDIMNHIEAVNGITGKTKSVCCDAENSVNCLNLKTMESAEVAEQIRNKTEALNKNTREIMNIMGVVKEINERINILSMNAAIEAARAGSAGNGFAVVAGEIRKLADQTKSTAKYIEEIISNVQRETADTAELINGADHIFKEQEVLAGETQRAFGDIVNHMEEIVLQVKNVNLSIEGIHEYKDSATISISTMAGNTLLGESSIDELLEDAKGQVACTAELVKLTEQVMEVQKDMENHLPIV